VQHIGDLLRDSQTQVDSEVEVKKSKKSKKAKKAKKTVNWHTDPNNFIAPEDPQFIPGSVDFSAGWFALGHEVTITHFAIVNISDLIFVTETL
jgi:hypothetical protein